MDLDRKDIRCKHGDAACPQRSNPSLSGIAPEHFEKIKNLFCHYPQIKDAILFGSRAKGNAREGSDIDIALKEKNLDSRLLTQIGLDYDALNLPWKLDLIIYDQVENPDLRDHIDRVGISIQS